ncbi:MAG: hypothetical protein J6P44_02370 [Bacteroidales bacterium]|nr:hypothetical protein [Bacteroidales bacterium]
MGYRLYVCKTYKVEYGTGIFNHLYECIDSILTEFCNNAEFNEQSTIIEIPKEEFKEFLNKITDNKDDKNRVISIIKYFVQKQLVRYRENIGDIDEYCNSEYNYILQGFKEIYEQADKDNDYIRLEWF